MKRSSWGCRSIVALLLVAGLMGSSHAAEPNETFLTATVLMPGQLSIVDELTAPNPYPDTFLGIRSSSGDIVFTNDDNSIYGNGFASGLSDLAIEGTSIDFAITGFEDEDFVGAHFEAGEYEVFIDIFGGFGQPIDSFSEVRTLTPGVVDEYSFSDATWLGASYDVNIENRVLANDIDFFTFTQLTPGAAYSAETMLANASQIDTMLGWFNDAGSLIDSDDDGGDGVMSLIDGVVPANGRLTFAVTGFGDPEFGGLHSQVGEYVLQVTEFTNPNGGDYNGNGKVDAADYTVYRNSLGQVGAGLPSDGNLNNMIDIGDYIFWKSRYGQLVGTGSRTGSANATNVPEPATIWFVIFSCMIVIWKQRSIAQPRRVRQFERRQLNWKQLAL